MRELLRRAGYGFQSSRRITDALLPMGVWQFDLLLVGPDLAPSAASLPAFQEACGELPVIELGSGFFHQPCRCAVAGYDRSPAQL